jgi:DNA polymerase-3 subunit gamma/tau
MKYQVIARKFRPQIFDEVVGQKSIVRTLQNAIQTDRVGHAYLFSGPRGVGKTTTARILAKGLNCLKGPSIEPCGECPSCTEIASAQSMDVLEIDGASNNGVDDIRELRDSARYAPSRDRYKIFIIDEVHMLSTAAFNALLKVLEEPPPHVVFIMATTERHKLPATILSRCQIFTFRTISAPEIQAHLRQIADREGAKIDDRGLSYIVKAAEGSMRDAQSLLDQIISFGGQEIAQDDVRDVLGFIPNEIIDRTSAALATQDSRELLECISIVVEQGLSIQQYIRECIARMRDLLMMKLGLDDKVLASPEDKKVLASDSGQFSEQELVRNFDMLLRLEYELKGTSQPRLHLEAGLVKLALAGRVRDIEDVIREFRQGVSLSPASVKPPIPSIPTRTAPPVSPAPTASPAATPQTRQATAAASPPIAKEPAPTLPVPTRSDPASNLDAAKEEPLVRRFLEVFRGDVAQVKPSKGE